ncbi:pre-rRNA-processing protein TSR1, partial [Pancytospora epiphaga]
VFTVVDLCGKFEDLNLDLPYKYVLHTPSSLTEIELSYLVRCSDLLLITVAGNEQPDKKLVNCIFRYMPTTVIVHNKKTKGTARGLAKFFGDVKTSDVSMLNQLLVTLEMKNTQLCSTRPFMVPREAVYEAPYLYLGGFMKHGLRSDKVIINGSFEGVVEELEVDGSIMKGTCLNVEEEEGIFVDTLSIDKKTEVDSCEADFSELEKENTNEEDSYEEFELEEPETAVDPNFDLIKKYGDYRGIRNMATCTFKGQEKPEYYKDLEFTKNFKQIQSLVLKRQSVIPSDRYVKLKIRMSKDISTNFIVLFNIFEYETRKTIYNYEYSTPRKGIEKEVVVDNGYRIYTATTILSRNLKHNMFQEESTLDHGIVSFVGPVSFSSGFAYIVGSDGEFIKIMNGESRDRIFYDSVKLVGRPIKFYKNYTVIRGMFYNSEQVHYFSSVRIEGKNNNIGFIKKPLGTKGLFKAYFSRPIKHDELVTLSLYKRVFL